MVTASGDRAGVELAYERIRSAIVEGEFAPGQRLIEQKIAERYDLSRTPVREAIRRLEAEGLVVSERNRGAMVREVDLDEVLDLYELRLRLESYAAELAAQRITEDELDALAAAVASFSEVVDSMDGRPDSAMASTRRLNEANSAIHDGIVRAAHHDRLSTLLRRTVDVPLVIGAFRTFDPVELARSDLFHRLILDAVTKGDGARASRLMAEHIAQGRDAVMAGLGVNGRVDPPG